MTDLPALTQQLFDKLFDPKLYAKLRDRVTASGFTVDQTIKTGFDK